MSIIRMICVGVFLFCAGCVSAKTPPLLTQMRDDQNFMILAALNLRQSDPKTSLEFLKRLYSLTKDENFLKEALFGAFVLQDSSLEELIKQGDTVFGDKEEFLWIKASFLIQNNRSQEALKTVKSLIKIAPVGKSFALEATLFSSLGEYTKALQSYKKAYKLDGYDEHIVQIANIYLNRLNSPKNAINELENLRKRKGCVVGICDMLREIYTKERKFNELVNLYVSFYHSSKNVDFLKDALGVYVFLKDYTNAITFLEKYKFDDRLLIELYAAKEDFAKALELSRAMFERTKDDIFKIMSGIFEYELKAPNLSEDDKKSIISSFEGSVEKNGDAAYLNYYGYFLIDYDIDVQKGIDLVKLALKKEPNIPHYVDSLAWGYYKIGLCEAAHDEMKKVHKFREFMSTKEAILHNEKIDECLKKRAK